MKKTFIAIIILIMTASTAFARNEAVKTVQDHYFHFFYEENVKTFLEYSFSHTRWIPEQDNDFTVVIFEGKFKSNIFSAIMKHSIYKEMNDNGKEELLIDFLPLAELLGYKAKNKSTSELFTGVISFLSENFLATGDTIRIKMYYDDDDTFVYVEDISCKTCHDVDSETVFMYVLMDRLFGYMVN